MVLDDGNRIHYDKLLICTGGEPRLLPIPGNELKNVFVIREIKSNSAILQGKSATAYADDRTCSP